MLTQRWPNVVININIRWPNVIPTRWPNEQTYVEYLRWANEMDNHYSTLAQREHANWAPV